MAENPSQVLSRVPSSSRSLLIRNADVVVTMDAQRRELASCDILCREGVVVEIGPGLSAAADESVDARGCVVTPGLVNTHHHLSQALTWAVPGGQDALLFGWLKTLYPIWRRMGPDAFRVSAQFGARGDGAVRLHHELGSHVSVPQWCAA